MSDTAHAEPSPIRAGDLVAGKYRIHDLLGHGGMGRVYSATNESTGKSVALKYILDASSDDARARFAREARAAGRIHHPNVVDVYDTVEHAGTTCIVMELLRGESLAARLARSPRLPIQEAIAIAIEVARGIAAAHDQGVIHRDLKPGNLFLPDSDGRLRVKVLDFGISKILEADPQHVTNTGVVLGTPHYLSPEQVRGRTDIDARVDVYAIGAVLYEMLTGRPPHEHTHLPALLVEIATVVPVAPHLVREEVPRALSDLTMRALAKDPDARIATARELADALERMVEPSTGERRISSRDVLARESLELMPTVEASVPVPSLERGRRQPIAVALALGVLVLVASALGWWWQQGQAGAAPATIAVAADVTPPPVEPPPVAPVGASPA
ncbi:MAG: serine/threonine protein kinase, partial [Sandaracinaceae bacterium]|nr:serine/threonine protein kinase [Sandaracinaceae bacterium]